MMLKVIDNLRPEDNGKLLSHKVCLFLLLWKTSALQPLISLGKPRVFVDWTQIEGDDFFGRLYVRGLHSGRLDQFDRASTT